MSSNKQIKAMVVDDAAFMRKQLVEIISNSDEIDVVGVARHGKEALEAIEILKPDVITLDVDMPVMDGITTIKHIMIRSPVPVVMVSGLADQSRITFEALRLGAIDFFPKPSGTISKDIVKNSDELIKTLKVAARSNLKAIKRAHLSNKDVNKDAFPLKNIQGILVIVAGHGSISGLIRLLMNIRGLSNLGVICVQDLSINILRSFGAELRKIVNCKVYNGQELQLKTGQCVLISEALLPVLNSKSEGLFLKGHATCLKGFFSSISSHFDKNNLALSILGGKKPDDIDAYRTLAKNNCEIFFLAPESCPCSELSAVLKNEKIGFVMKNEYEMCHKIHAYSRRLILECLSKN